MAPRKLKQNKSVADKVHELLNKQNNDTSDESSAEETEPRVTEFDENEYELPQAQSTDFRKRNVKLLSEQSTKYKGKVSSRKEFEKGEYDEEEDTDPEDNETQSYEASDSEAEKHEESDAESSGDAVDDDAFRTFAAKLEGQAQVKVASRKRKREESEGSDDADEQDDAQETSDEEDIDEEESEESDIETESVGDQQIVAASNREEELQKGICVKNQLQIWERLLELRIHSQKMLTNANQLPDVEVLKNIPDIATTHEKTVASLGNLLNTLCELQHNLGKQNTELHENVQFSYKRVDTDGADHTSMVKHFDEQLQKNFENFRVYRDQVLLKWDDRTRLMTPGAGKRKAALEDYDVLKKIEHTLNSRLASFEIELRQSAENSNKAALKYDDSDFYHQQLRELIEHKANTTSDMCEVTNQYMELQKLRQKMKKKVDTRASKGRKIRYVVHKKLVNFMAPQETSTWTEQSKDELYKSLFAA